MLPKINRLSLRTEFKRLKLEGKNFPGKYFSLIVGQKDNDSPPQFAFIVSKRVHPLSTVRHRVKRLISEAVKKLLPQIPEGTEVIFLVRSAIVGRTLSEITYEIEKVLLKTTKDL